MSPRRSAVASPVSFAATMKCAKRSRSRASGCEHAVRVRREPGERAVLAGEDLQHLVRLAQRRVRAVDDLVEVLAPAREAGAELVQQDREALAIGQPQDAVEQVEVDRRARVRDRAAGARPRRRPRRSSRAAGCPALPGSHSTNFSPISPWSRIVQLASSLNGMKPSSSIRSVTAACVLGRHVHVRDHARPARRRSSRPRRARASTRCRRSRARSSGPACRRPSPRARCRSRSRAGSPRSGRGRRTASWAGGVSSGSQPSAATGAEPSGGGCMAPPGQRRRLPRSKPSSRLLRRRANSSVLPAVAARRGLNTGMTRA